MLRTSRGSARAALLLGALLCMACARAAGSTPPPAQARAEEAAEAARAALARLPTEARLDEIKDERLRRAVRATYRAVVELADNRDPGKVAALNSRFERAYAAVERATARGQHRTCTANCKALDGEPCTTKCRAAGKVFCGCKLIVFGCVVAECLF
jgi:membrane-bound lytic murein transglycosylase B